MLPWHSYMCVGRLVHWCTLRRGLLAAKLAASIAIQLSLTVAYKYTDFKIRVVEAPKLTYANRVTVYDTPELETLKLDALKYDATRLGQWHLTRTAP